jgi:hypothetical protein
MKRCRHQTRPVFINLNATSAFVFLIQLVIIQSLVAQNTPYYSITDGDWDSPASWSNTNHSGPPASSAPGSGCNVFIGDGSSYNHTITLSSGGATCDTLTLFAGSVLDLGSETGNNFGFVTSGSSGKLRITAHANTANFPAGNFSGFLGVNGGTVEYYSTTKTFTMPTTSEAPTSASLTSYYNLSFSLTSGKYISMPASDLDVYNDMTVAAASATDYVELNNACESYLKIHRHLVINSGMLLFMNWNSDALTMTVDSNITIASGGTFKVDKNGPGADNTLTIGGNLVNNGTFDMSADQTYRAYPVTFTGAQNASISGIGSTTDFFALIVNKGTSENSILDVTSAAFSFSNNNNPLTLTNGTFRLTTDVEVTVASDTFEIPSTARLSANGGDIAVIPGGADGDDVLLDGSIQVLDGSIVIGDSSRNTNTDIVYGTTGTPSLDIQGGRLCVAGQVRRATSMGSGSLSYNQSGNSMVTIFGKNGQSGFAQLAVTNTGSSFNMAEGTLTLVRGNSSSVSDLLITPTTSSVTGGTIVFGTGETAGTGGENTFNVESNASLWNITVNGTTNPKTLTLQTYDHSFLGDLLIESTSIFNSNGLDLDMGGDFITHGTFNHDNATVSFIGMSQQITGGSANLFNNLTIGSTSTTTMVTSGQEILGVLLCDGTLSADNKLTLLSSASQTALIDGTGSGDVTGTITMQRYLPSGFGYKYFSSPFQDATVGEFSDDMDLTASFPTFYSYHEEDTASGWDIYTTTSNPLNQLEGYAVNFGPDPATQTVDISGTVNNGELDARALFNHDETFTLGFNLMGNPYPSPIDWDASSGWSRTNIDDAIYYFNAGTTNQYLGTYSSYVDGISSDGQANNIIPSMQGFFIHVSDGTYPVSGSIEVDNQIRTNDLSPLFHKSQTTDEQSFIRITAGYADHQPMIDPLVIRFDKTGSQAYDPERDALKLMNTDPAVPNFFVFSTKGRMLSIQTIKKQDATSYLEIPIGIHTETPGMILFSLHSHSLDQAGNYIYLQDGYRHTCDRLLFHHPNPILLDAANYNDRFSLIISDSDIRYVPSKDTHLYVWANGNKINLYVNLESQEQGTLVIYNLMGQKMLVQTIDGSGYHTMTLYAAPAMYVATLSTAGFEETQKFILSTP